MIEVKVRIKSEDKTVSEKFLCYQNFTVSNEDLYLKKLVEQTLATCAKELIDPEVSITIRYQW